MGRTAITLAIVLTVLLAGCAGMDLDTSGIEDIDTVSEVDDETESSEEDTETEDETPDSDANGNDETTEPTGELEIHHIDVGQADSTLIITPTGETVLIDTGDWRQSGQGVIDYLEDNDIDRIDHLVATHSHADHIGGHDEIIKHYETEHNGIGAAYDSGVAHTSATYERYLDAVEEHDVQLFEVEEGDELPIEDETLSASVLNPPTGYSGSDMHYASVTISFEFGEFAYLTTGDVENDAEQRLVEEWGDSLDADAYHAGHHGSSTSSTRPFMDEVGPSIAIISSNLESQYGHPHDETLETFSELNIETFWTGVHGDIVLTTDGETVETDTETEFSTDPLDLLDEKNSNNEESTSYGIAGQEFNTVSGLLTP